GMTTYEIMLSESQERMLVVVARETLPRVLEVFARWELPAVVIGRVTGDGMVRVREGETVVAEVPARLFTDECPVYVREGREDPAIAAARARDLAGLPEPEDYGAALLELLREPSIASKRVIWRRYDHTIGTNTVIGPGTDAAVLRLKCTRKAVALTTDCNARLCYLDPYAGAAAAEGDHVLLLGAQEVSLGGSAYLALRHGLDAGRPVTPDLDLAARLVRLLPDLAASGLLRSAHDCAEGGLAVALAECCLWGGRGGWLAARLDEIGRA